ncbi:unnamed protein product [Microthlaspi erraticum]|uniref:F-box domain-containing protein n=1 Tax=Microthlaspi erraticum TaxID=1685480 RepID=A0A6D2HW43_9BRAS|nr:unnamed protein product [Microthlaspi erraticum]
MMTMLELPEDLLEEIFCRVPALSLIRLRSTCKRWNRNRLLNDKKFITNHLEKSPKQFMPLMLQDFRLCLMRFNQLRFSPIRVKGKLSLIDPRSSLDHIKISQVFHCDSLLLCHTEDKIPRLVVWNPCTGQTRWIKITRFRQGARYALGFYQDKKSNVGYSYKILSGMVHGPSFDKQDIDLYSKQEFEIYEMNSNAWRVLEVDATLDFIILYLDHGASLKGKTYWIAEDKEKGRNKFLVSFDYSTERFEYLCLPRQYDWYENLSLSVVRGEKLSVLLQRYLGTKTNIWVSSKICDETKAVSWSKVLSVDLDACYLIPDGGSFVFDEERKVLVCCNWDTAAYIVGEDNNVRDYEAGSSSKLSLFDYAPSLTQIQQDLGGKRKRGDERLRYKQTIFVGEDDKVRQEDFLLGRIISNTEYLTN